MSTSVLYHGFGVKGYGFIKAEYGKGVLTFHIEKAEDKRCCSSCGSLDVIKKGQVTRRLKTLPIGWKRVYLEVHLSRLRCRECGLLRQEKLGISFPRKRWTRALGRYVVDLLRSMTVEDVARHLGMSWDTIKEIHVWALKKKYSHIPLKSLRYLGVDEIAVRKGHRYMTVVVDLESGRVVWVAKGRKKSSLAPFMKKLKQARAPIEGIAMDMWKPYLRAVLKYFPENVVVFDRYHIIQDYNRMLDELRRSEAAQSEDRKVFAGIRYLLLQGEEKIQGKKEAKEKLEYVLSVNRTLYIGYVLKEELRHLWDCKTWTEASTYLGNWLQKAWSSGIRQIKKIADRLHHHLVGILNYFDHRITTGPVEGINNKIKVLKRKAYGFRDEEYFKLRILALHESRYALVG